MFWQLACPSSRVGPWDTSEHTGGHETPHNLLRPDSWNKVMMWCINVESVWIECILGMHGLGGASAHIKALGSTPIPHQTHIGLNAGKNTDTKIMHVRVYTRVTS